MAPSPVVARWELSRRLSARRKDLGVDVKTITEALGFTRNYWSAVENDRTLIAADKLHLLFNLLDFDTGDQAELLQLREDSRKRGWWDDHPSLNDGHKRFFGMEAGADRIRLYDGHLVPGILQTDAYARSVLATDPGLSAIDLDRSAAVRRQRQRVLESPRPPTLEVLLSEAVLRQQVGGIETQIEQLGSLRAQVSALGSHLRLRILPFAVNPGAIITSTTLSFLEYDNPHLPTMAWQEGVQLFDDLDAEHDDREFRRLEIAWADGIGRALPPEPSLALLEQAIGALGKGR